LTLRLLVAAALGGAIGIERELRERGAGLRTHMMVALGAALFTVAGAYGFADFYHAGGNVARIDPTRVAAQVVTGIGFLGAGAIIRQGVSVRGLTTAGTLWVVAAIGLAAGAGYYSAAVIATALVLFALWPLRFVAYRALGRFRPGSARLLVALTTGTSPGPLIDEVESVGGRIDSVEISQDGDRRVVELDVVLPPHREPASIVSALADIDHVLDVRWAE
jgi:putative Mg2+ transporter-C (MgtC) family protein